MTPSITAQRTPTMQPEFVLPPEPGLSAPRDQARRRLVAIETDTLPALAQTRACLTRVWYSDAADAVPLHTSSGESFPVHPAGADRLGGVLAHEDALRREAMALRELIAAFEIFDAGGSAVMRELLDPRDSDALPAARGVALPCRAVPRAPTDERAYTVWLLEYLVAVQQELSRSGAHGDPGHLESLRLELDELEARVQRRAGTVNVVASGARRRGLLRTA